MPTSIKKQIADKVIELLQPLKDDAVVRSLALSRNPIPQLQGPKPAITVYVSPETEVEKDNRGRTYQFDVVINIHYQGQSGLDTTEDTILPEIQRLIEEDIQLSGLANNVDGGTAEVFYDEGMKPEGLTRITYTVQYRRKLADPYNTY